MLEKKKFRWLSSPNMLDVARDGYAVSFASRFPRMKKHKAGKCYAYPKVFHLNMVKRVRLENYIVSQ